MRAKEWAEGEEEEKEREGGEETSRKLFSHEQTVKVIRHHFHHILFT
jgi:hypothetical protein